MTRYPELMVNAVQKRANNPDLGLRASRTQLIDVLNRTTRRADDLVIVLGHLVQKNRERPSTAFADNFFLLGHFDFSRAVYAASRSSLSR